MSDQRSARVQGPVFAGIDWGGQHHQLCVVDRNGERLLQLRVTHDVAGLAELDRQLHRFGDRLPIAVERSEGLLVEHLQAVGHAVFPVSPRISARARERYKVAAVKDDRFDAFVLADTLRHEHGHWRVLPVPSPLLAEIKALTRDRDRLLETQQATEHHLRVTLAACHPAPAGTTSWSGRPARQRRSPWRACACATVTRARRWTPLNGLAWHDPTTSCLTSC